MIEPKIKDAIMEIFRLCSERKSCYGCDFYISSDCFFCDLYDAVFPRNWDVEKLEENAKKTGE